MAIESIVLAGVALGACLACIYAVFFYGRKLQANVYVRSSLVEATAQQLKKVHIYELDEKKYLGPLDSKENPFPDEAGPDYSPYSLWSYPEGALNPYVPIPYDPYPGLTEEQEAFERKRHEEKEAQTSKKCNLFRDWARKEKEIYENKKRDIEKDALEIAEQRVPKSMDISILGGGFSFLLEFSTVIVIIFALVILGILGTLEGKEISTILAAIAGYVLGKASTGTISKQSGELTEQSSSK